MNSYSACTRRAQHTMLPRMLLAGQNSSWDRLPDGLLACALSFLKDQETQRQCIATARATCTGWRKAVDSNLQYLEPHRWPIQSAHETISGSFPRLRYLHLSHLGYGDSDVGAHSGSDLALALGTGAGAVPAAAMHSNRPAKSNTGQGSICHLDLMDYVASRWPYALPHVTPVAALRIWRDLPLLRELQALSISGSMLLVQSVQTTVDCCPDAAAGLAALENYVRDDWACDKTVVITHTYTLQLPLTLCQLTGLQSLTVEWQLVPGDEDKDSYDSTAAAIHGNSLVFCNRRRSYEGNSNPTVVHVAHHQLQLPASFTRLSNLQHLVLAASIASRDALRPLCSLSQLKSLVLGPGEVDVRALLPLAAAGVLQQLKRLALKQQGPWDARAVAAVLAATTQLQLLEVHELEIIRQAAVTAIPPEERLTQADMQAVSATLHTLHWDTCSQRLGSGSSLLAQSPGADAVPVTGAAAAAAAGFWLGGITALKQLRITGLQAQLSVLHSANIEAVSFSIGACGRLEQLDIVGLGVPILPAALAQLQHLHTVNIASAAVTRRVAAAADAALSVLGSCSTLRSLRLSGCELRQLPAWLAGIDQLKQLQLQGNYLQELPSTLPCLGLPSGLQLLDFSDNRLRDLPDSIAELNSLVSLHLDGNYVTSLPASIWQLSCLEVLTVKANMLPELPEVQPAVGTAGSSMPGPAVCCCSTACRSGRHTSSCGSGSYSLQQLQMFAGAAVNAEHMASWCTEDAEIVGGTGVLCSRQHPFSPIDRSDPHDATVHVGVTHVQCLHCSSAGACTATCSGFRRRSSDSSSSFVSALSSSSSMPFKLRRLDVSDNQLAQLPGNIHMLSLLQHLDLNNNQLRILPETGSIWALNRLTSLSLASNHIRKLPAAITQLQHLEVLDVSGNHLPTSIARSTSGGDLGSKTVGVTDAAPGRMWSDTTAVTAAAADFNAAVNAPCPAFACELIAPAMVSQSDAPESSNNSMATAGWLSSRRSSNGSGSSTISSSKGSSKSLVRKTLKQLPVPLRSMRQLRQLRVGGQHIDECGGHQCSLQLLLGGIGELLLNIKSLAPPGHQCPVRKVAAAAVAHLAGVTSGKRAKEERKRQLIERVHTEPGWVVLPAPKVVAAGAAAAGPFVAM